MEKRSLNLMGYALIALIIYSCNNSAGSKNEFLGEIPSLAKQLKEEMEAKEKEIKECTDFEKAFKLNNEKKLLVEEHQNRTAEFNSSSDLIGKEVPFRGINNDLFEIKKVSVKALDSRGRVNLNFNLVFNNTTKEQRLSANSCIYFTAIDAQGNPIENTKGISWFGSRNIKPGMSIDITGQVEAAEALQNFAEVAQISKEEYDSLN